LIRIVMRAGWLGALALLAGCAAQQQAGRPPAGVGKFAASEQRVPPFASVPYEPLNRQAVAAIALREWRLFGSLVDDEPERTGPPVPPEAKPERFPGLWQRVGEYWWIGMDPGAPESAWTGKHDGDGEVFPYTQDGYYAWSAAFISYVMRIAGAGNQFPYSASHSDYIDASVSGSALLQGERPSDYAPQPGDLICMGRGRSAKLTFSKLPVRHFPAHCDIVVKVDPGQLSVVGGNVDDAVTMKHVPVTTDGKLATPDGSVLDTRWPWFVVLHVNYDDRAVATLQP
jgi:hypothetical protein